MFVFYRYRLIEKEIKMFKISPNTVGRFVRTESTDIKLVKKIQEDAQLFKTADKATKSLTDIKKSATLKKNTVYHYAQKIANAFDGKRFTPESKHKAYSDLCDFSASEKMFTPKCFTEFYKRSQLINILKNGTSFMEPKIKIGVSKSIANYKNIKLSSAN